VPNQFTSPLPSPGMTPIIDDHQANLTQLSTSNFVGAELPTSSTFIQPNTPTQPIANGI